MSTETLIAHGQTSLAESMSLLSDGERRHLLDSLSDREADELRWDWEFWARPAQLPPPGTWFVWLVMAGRGFGKTRIGAEWIRDSAQRFARVNILGATADDARDIMIEGESGILAVCPPHQRPAYLPSKRRLEWPNGARTLVFTADEPERLRGKQHDRLWADELGAWRYAREAWTQAMLGLRLGAQPQAVATTTPRPIAIIRELLARQATGEVVVTRGSTYDNRGNLAPEFFSQVIRSYEGTRLGRQELAGELIEETEGALWTIALIDLHRVDAVPAGVSLARVVVAVDPPATSGGAECGITVSARGSDKRGYVLADCSRRGTPSEWATAAVAAFDVWKADAVVIETNQGGEMATNTLRTIRPTLPIVAVHAARGKATRAEPISSLYEQGRISHVGSFPALEDQMTTWVPGDTSPDRMDALVWGLTELMPIEEPAPIVAAVAMPHRSTWGTAR